MLELLTVILFIGLPIWVGFLLFDAVVELVQWTKLRNKYAAVTFTK